MIILGNLLIAIGNILHSLIYMMNFLLIANAILSWVSPDPRNMLVQFVYNTTEPILTKVRQYIPPLGMIDVSVIAALFGLYLIDMVIANSLIKYGYIFSQSVVKTVGV